MAARLPDGCRYLLGTVVDPVGVVGDHRLRADLDAVADIGDGVAWAPSPLVILGAAPLVEVLVAVRRHELELTKDGRLDELARALRFTWST